MAYIQPGTVVKILRNVPLDNTYTNTLYFNTIEEQKTYFEGKVKVTFSPQTYQRHSVNSIKVEYRPEDLYDCNYIMFNNAPFGTRWFYGFITDTEYIANNVAIIYYELDVMQTYHFDYQLTDCFIEREHSASDIVGENTIPEDIQLGPYVTTSFTDILSGSDVTEGRGLSISVFTCERAPIEISPYYGPMINNFFGKTPLPYYVYLFPCTNEGVEQANAVCASYLDDNKEKAVIGMFVTPNALINPTTTSDGAFYSLPNKTLNLPADYEVKNNKLYTYPFCALCVQGDTGNQVLRYENFGANGALMLTASYGPDSSATITPTNYEGVGVNTAYQVTVNNFSQLAWINDGFQDFMGNTKAIRYGLGAAAAVGGVVALPHVAAAGKTAIAGSKFASGIATKLIAREAVAKAATDISIATVGKNIGTAALIGGVGAVVKSITEGFIAPDVSSGNLNAGNTNLFFGWAGFRVQCHSVKGEYLLVADDYFNRFGYKTLRIKKPNRNVRPHWTFTKSIGCDVLGDIPAVYKYAICKIYDSGITFWKNPSEVGDYSLDNRV